MMTCVLGCSSFYLQVLQEEKSLNEYISLSTQHESYHYGIMDASLMSTSFQRTGQELSVTRIYKNLVILTLDLTQRIDN